MTAVVTGAEIVVTAVERRGEGLTANRKPWTLWIVHSQSGAEFRTFDGVLAHRAFESVGRRVEIEWQWDGYSRDLKSLKPLEDI